MSNALIKSAASHRRLARSAQSRLRAAIRAGIDASRIVATIDANRRARKMDLDAAR